MPLRPARLRSLYPFIFSGAVDPGVIMVRHLHAPSLIDVEEKIVGPPLQAVGGCHASHVRVHARLYIVSSGRVA